MRNFFSHLKADWKDTFQGVTLKSLIIPDEKKIDYDGINGGWLRKAVSGFIGFTAAAPIGVMGLMAVGGWPVAAGLAVAGALGTHIVRKVKPDMKMPYLFANPLTGAITGAGLPIIAAAAVLFGASHVLMTSLEMGLKAACVPFISAAKSILDAPLAGEVKKEPLPALPDFSTLQPETQLEMAFMHLPSLTQQMNNVAPRAATKAVTATAAPKLGLSPS